jgi:hypothetical protein
MRRWSLLPLLLGSTLVACSATDRPTANNVEATTAFATSIDKPTETPAKPFDTAASGDCTIDTFDPYCSRFVATFDVTQPGELTQSTSSDQSVNQVSVTFDGNDYVCERARAGTSRDLDCTRIVGGHPATTGATPDLRCTERSDQQFDCTDRRYYPREMDHYTPGSIGGRAVVCNAEKCWAWDTTYSPIDAASGPADYTCDKVDHCTRSG